MFVAHICRCRRPPTIFIVNANELEERKDHTESLHRMNENEKHLSYVSFLANS